MNDSYVLSIVAAFAVATWLFFVLCDRLQRGQQ
jgi:hypothetical protein